MDVTYRIVGRWDDVFEVVRSPYPHEVGSLEIKPHVQVIRRQYRTREAARQAMPHLIKRFPPCAVWTIEEA